MSIDNVYLKKIAQESEINEEILDSMARTLFVDSWASGWGDLEQEYDEEFLKEVCAVLEVEIPHFSQMNIMEIAPKTEPGAYEKAKEIYQKIEQINGIDLNTFIPPGEDEFFDKESFGFYLMMQSLGTGSSWSGDHEDHGLKLPYAEDIEVDEIVKINNYIYENYDLYKDDDNVVQGSSNVFYDNIDKKFEDHPLLRGYKSFPKIRENLLKHAQELSAIDLVDAFSSSQHVIDKKDLRNTVFEASKSVHDIFASFNMPIFPKISLRDVKGVKYASHDNSEVVGGCINFNVELTALSGVKKTATVPVAICEGEIVPPCVMDIQGSIYLISQKEIDGILERITSYELEPIRKHMFAPPLTRFEKETATAIRNEIGWKAREKDNKRYLQQKSSSSKKASLIRIEETEWDDSYLVINEDTGETEKLFDPQKIIQVAMDLGMVISKEDLHDIEKGPEGLRNANSFIKEILGESIEYPDYLMENTFRGFAQKAGLAEVDEAIDLLSNKLRNEVLDVILGSENPVVDLKNTFGEHVGIPLSDEDWQSIYEYFVDLTNSEKNKVAKKVAVKSTPAGFELVVKEMRKAQENLEDTFPRPFHYILRNYILKHVSTANKDHWEPHLINVGLCLNPWGKGPSSRAVVASKKQSSFVVNMQDLEGEEFNSYEEAIAAIQEVYGQDAQQMAQKQNSLGQYTSPKEILNQWANMFIQDVGEIVPLAASKKAQEESPKEADFEKEIPLEVSETPIEVDESFEQNGSDKFYPDTKTPIEIGDSIRFNIGNESMRGTIVEVIPERDLVIVKSKGIEYRVAVEDIQPLNSTFKKMYL